ncbi:hypothetical protein, partial [Rhizobium leguminosarum]|uniref:hypothetical protein n=1 Tax=Rhizobium leguminosarum TaxID=384 RepID=UPI00197F1258
FDKLVQTAPVGEGQLQIASRHPKSPKGSHCFFWHVALGNRMYLLSQADRIMDRREPVKTSRDELLVVVSFQER